MFPWRVAADKIAMLAMRCVGLLDLMGVTDRSGDGKVWEVYPAVALRVWGATSKEKMPLKLADLLQQVRDACPWLHIPDEASRSFVSNHHAFDALIASLVTRAAYLGLTECPPAKEVETAKLEGWIAVPDKDCLGTLHNRSQHRYPH